MSLCEHTFLRVYVCANVISSKISVYRKHSNTYEHGNLYTCSTNIHMTWITIHKQTDRQTDKQTWHIYILCACFCLKSPARHIHCVRIYMSACSQFSQEIEDAYTRNWYKTIEGHLRKVLKLKPDVESVDIPNLGTLLTVPSKRLAERFPDRTAEICMISLTYQNLLISADVGLHVGSNNWRLWMTIRKIRSDQLWVSDFG